MKRTNEQFFSHLLINYVIGLQKVVSRSDFRVKLEDVMLIIIDHVEKNLKLLETLLDPILY